LYLKIARVSADLTVSGRLFHTVRLAKNLVLVRGTMKSRLVTEQRQWCAGLLLAGWMDSLIYTRDSDCRVPWTSEAQLCTGEHFPGWEPLVHRT